MKKSILYSLLTLLSLVCFSVNSMNVRDLNQKLIDTVINTKLTEIQIIQLISKLLKEGADINSKFYARGDGGRIARNVKTGTILIEAARMGLKHVVGFLLAQPDINIDAQNDDGQTALMKTATYWGNNKTQYLDIAKDLINHGAKIDAKCYSGQTVLHLGVIYKKINLLTLILEEASKKSYKLFYELLNETDKDSDTALHKAIKNSDYELCKMLIEAGINIDYTTINFASDIATESANWLAKDKADQQHKISDLLRNFKQEVRKQIVEAQIFRQNNIPGLLDIIMTYY